jgi:SOS-response transcriptional repressor LexA
MIHTINVNYLTKRDIKASNPFEAKMKRALDKAGLTQTSLAIKLNIGQSTVNNYYKRTSLLAQRGVPFALKFIKAHKIKDDEALEIVKEIFGAEYDSYIKEAGSLVEKNHHPIPNPISKGDLVAIRDLGTIQAGLKGLSYASDSYDYVNVLKDDLNGYLPENCFRVTVTGDSMVCSDVAQRIAPGTRAIFHSLTSKMQPKDGDVVSVWLKEEDTGVIKVFNKSSDYVILNSLNKAHRPIILDEHNQGIIQGILISITRMYR